jgi:hypothetical protein
MRRLVRIVDEANEAPTFMVLDGGLAAWQYYSSETGALGFGVLAGLGDVDGNLALHGAA